MRFLDMKAASSAGGLSTVPPAKLCDSCKSSAAVIFCRVDSAFLCISCDSRIHCLNKHGRVWMCEVCEQAPAAVTCKADAAALCVSCDFDIHSANPLARRHERVAVEPFYDSAESLFVKSSDFNFFGENNVHDELGSQTGDLDSTSWMVHNSNDINNNSKLSSKMLESSYVKNHGDLFFSEMDNFLDFEFPSYNQRHGTADSVVPVPTTLVAAAPSFVNHSSENCFEIDFGRSKISPFNFSNHSISQNVSSSDVGVVPDGNSMSEISYPFGRNVNRVPESSVSGSTSQACGLDREARVLRYREKRKNRKFQKTIRYASRKAYAETRPRIKGRFAKRTEIEAEPDQIYGSASPVAFGVVPNFWS